MKKQSGCMTAFLIVLGVLGVVVLIHLAVAYYFLQKHFQLKEVREAPAASAPIESGSDNSQA